VHQHSTRCISWFWTRSQIEEHDTRIKQDADTIQRCQEVERDLTNALNLAKQHVANREAVCIGKDNEIGELKLQLEVNVLTVLAL
jgi:hypothetical protein